MPNINQSLQLVRNMGMRYTKYRIGLEIEKRTGLYKKKFPIDPSKKRFIELSEWKSKSLFWGVQQSDRPETVSSELPDFEAYRSGKFPFFSASIQDLGENYDWITNPDTGYKYDAQLHWSDIQDLNAEAGDIKFVWEKSRFAYLYDVIRHDFYTKEDHSQWVFNEIQSWLNSNAINCGPNYKCSQEISLRVLNWTYALNYYKNSIHLTEELFQEIMHAIYWQLKHVYSNINFSRIAVRNNHAITETLTLYLGSIFYPFFPESSLWKKDGKKWFEQEIDYQIYNDGTFLQFSHNYHRVVIQLLTWAVKTADFIGDRFSDHVYDKAYKSLAFLYTCQDQSTGWLSNYGNNDGALFFKFSSSDYRDYKPQLNTLHYLLTGENLYEVESCQEDISWFKAKQLKVSKREKLMLNSGWSSFEDGGFYILREEDTITFLRCGNHKDRPAQADNLHLDIWHNGRNVVFDGGTYKYNTDPTTLRYFMGTESHNSVMLDNYDQMKKGSRFIWYNWTQRVVAEVADNTDEFYFSGTIKAFSEVSSDITHTRTLRKKKGQANWIVEDKINGKPSDMKLKQLWHTISDVHLNSEDGKGENVRYIQKAGWKSDYYGKKETIEQRVLETTSNKITTTLTLE